MSADADGAEGTERRATARRRRSTTPPTEPLGIASLWLAIVGAGLAFGAQQSWALIAAALAAAAAALLLRPTSTPRLSFLLFALAVYTLFQLVPLPLSWVALLSPGSADVWQGAHRTLGIPPPRWISLSVDPAATALEALKWFGYACVFVAASCIRTRRGPLSLALLVLGATLAVCVVTLVHGIFDVPRIYGIYRPNDPSQWLRGPFVNGNNLAGYLNVGLFAGVGLWLSGERKLPSWIFALAVPLFTVQILLTESRGGVAALLVGILAVVLGLLRQRRIVSRRLALGAGAALVIGAGLSLALGGARVVHALGDRDLHAKTSAWRWSLDLIRDFPVFGVGRGAFETAFQPYRRLLGKDWTMVFPYTENFPLQWATDWGGAVAVGALVAWVLLVKKSATGLLREPLRYCLAVGVAVLLLQNLVDLGLEIFGVFALALVALAGALGSTPNSKQRRLPVAVPMTAGVVVSAIIVVSMGATSVRAERERVSKAYTEWVRNGARDPRAFLGELRASIQRHPAEAYFPLVASIPAARVGDDPLRWIGRALERSPLDAQAHLRLAEVLAGRGATKQALFHLRLAAVYDGVLRDAALIRAATLARTGDDLLSAFPRDLPGASLLFEVCQKTLGEIRIECWREVVARNASDVRAERELAEALLDASEAGAPPCAGENDRDCAAQVARLLASVEAKANDWRSKELRARELARAGDARRAADLLVEHCPTAAEGAACRARAVEFAARTKDLRLVASAAERYVAATCGEPSRCALAHEHVAKTYEGMGATGLALKHYSVAAREEPSVSRWLANAEAAARAGSGVSSRAALDRARGEGELTSEQHRRARSVEALLDAQESRR